MSLTRVGRALEGESAGHAVERGVTRMGEGGMAMTEVKESTDSLDSRKSAILRTIVTQYIDTAQPVGSSHVVRDGSIEVSPATVRSDMAALERDGYLSHPHTSAGRVPTDKGYRFFVDHLTSPSRLPASEARKVHVFFDQAHGELEAMLRQTSGLLSQLTDYAAVVVGPTHEALTIRSTLLVELAPGVGLFVVVFSNGTVEKHTIDFSEELTAADLDLARSLLAARLTGQTTACAALEFDLDPVDRAIAPLLSACLATLTESAGRPRPTSEQVYVGGAAKMASQFDALAQVRSVLSILEESYVVVSLLQEVLAQGQSVSIGRENGHDSLAQCSVVVAPYAVDEEMVGTIGVLGPTRMNYPQALAAVALVGQRLGRQLGSGR